MRFAIFAEEICLRNFTRARKHFRMKTIFPILAAGALAISAFAQAVKTNDAPASAEKITPPIAAFGMSAGEISAPFVLTNGCISQPEQTEVAGGGKAIFNFTITNAGDYILKGIVNATDESANSFYLNIDAQPEDPLTIWDFTVTEGFQQRVVSWRGNGDQDSDEFSPKKFHLNAGTHKLIIVGREPGQLKSISIYPAAASAEKSK